MRIINSIFEGPPGEEKLLLSYGFKLPLSALVAELQKLQASVGVVLRLQPNIRMNAVGWHATTGKTIAGATRSW